MDLVEARKKARQQKQDQEKEAGPARETRPIETAAPKKPEPKKPARPASGKKTAKPAAPKSAPPQKSESKSQAPKAKPPEIAPRPKPREKPRSAEDFFVDMNFGEDLPGAPAAEKEVMLEEKKPEPKPAPGPAASREIQAMKSLAGELMPEAAAARAEVKLEEGPQIPPALDQEKDFYELVVEDLVQYGYGMEAEKNLVEFLSFRLGTEIYAVPLIRIQQIIKPRPVTLVPGSPEYIIGIISLRGTVIPVFDLRKRLGLSITQPTRLSRIIIIKLENETVSGILVDQVMEVARVPQDSIEATPAVFSGIEGEFIDGIARHKNQMMIVLNLAQVVLGRKETGKAE